MLTKSRESSMMETFSCYVILLANSPKCAEGGLSPQTLMQGREKGRRCCSVWFEGECYRSCEKVCAVTFTGNSSPHLTPPPRPTNKHSNLDGSTANMKRQRMTPRKMGAQVPKFFPCHPGWWWWWWPLALPRVSTSFRSAHLRPQTARLPVCQLRFIRL